MDAIDERWTYVAEGAPKPFIHPLRTPAGHCVTRLAPPDHAWHRGLWFTIKYVNGDNFWEEVEPHGTVRHVGPEALEWVAPSGDVVLREKRRLSAVELDDDAWALDLRSVLTATVDVTLDRTPFSTWGGYGGLALRGPGDWHDTRLLLDDDTVHDRLLGVASAWCDLSGAFAADGSTGGIALLDHPTNPRTPVPWYGSTRSPTYGTEGWSNFLNAAFLFHEPLQVGAGDELAFTYRAVLHDGIWSADLLGATHERWARR